MKELEKYRYILILVSLLVLGNKFGPQIIVRDLTSCLQLGVCLYEVLSQVMLL